MLTIFLITKSMSYKTSRRKGHTPAGCLGSPQCTPDQIPGLWSQEGNLGSKNKPVSLLPARAPEPLSETAEPRRAAPTQALPVWKQMASDESTSRQYHTAAPPEGSCGHRGRPKGTSLPFTLGLFPTWNTYLHPKSREHHFTICTVIFKDFGERRGAWWLSK